MGWKVDEFALDPTPQAWSRTAQGIVQDFATLLAENARLKSQIADLELDLASRRAVSALTRAALRDALDKNKESRRHDGPGHPSGVDPD